MMINYHFYQSPVGALLLLADSRGLLEIRFAEGEEQRLLEPDWVEDQAVFEPCIGQLDAYFAGKLTEFDLPLVYSGTEFQQQVMHALETIPYGQTCSYAELAKKLGREGAARAVGSANRRNPLPIVVPCHRVIGANGDLTGFAGGLDIKRKLLALEGVSVSI
ncbi:MAG: methylated-DNA--[protein]-cysteine S-methyltransferase [Pseudomonadales bacterium]|jgi:methylated-DNA-[protein]-cysteine S-methyltransferase